MTKKLIVSSNCQTEGIAEALEVLLPTHEIVQVPIPDHRTDAGYLAASLSDADILLTSDPHCDASFVKNHPSLTIIEIPQIYFTAFHPDITYAVNSNQQFVRCLDSDYHSAICLWSWKQNISFNDTITFFNDRTFSQLGYLNNWNDSVSGLNDRFKHAELDFTRFWGAVKRTGTFMHSINHPNAFVLSEMSKQVAVKLGAPDSVYNEPVHRLLTEKLDAIRWPVYPTIAKLYGSRGAYQWKIRKKKYFSLEEYVEAAFESYESSGYRPEDLSFYTDGYSQFDFQMTQCTEGSR